MLESKRRFKPLESLLIIELTFPVEREISTVKTGELLVRSIHAQPP